MRVASDWPNGIISTTPFSFYRLGIGVSILGLLESIVMVE